MNTILSLDYYGIAAPAIVKDFRVRSVGKTTQVTVELAVSSGETLAHLLQQLHELKNGGKQ
ncbi:hypothetical protein [Sphingomonas sp. CCH15-F11]|uniref:hypothetical protein n=1 Tax=Sphingomonas sp. CCH15-F11 TaxID=1768785 RepID=UPI000A5AA19A|nr:hypothetical protein [Sphingomonas sp. CCH15-F11]